jgi:hypothetical protein
VKPISFARLSEAVAFLADHLDVGDTQGIAAECSDASQDAVRGAGRPLSPMSSRMWAIEALGEQHRSQSLRVLYAEREFPVEKETFKLGGHGAELGHIHVDFLRIDAAWLLKEIWICR